MLNFIPFTIHKSHVANSGSGCCSATGGADAGLDAAPQPPAKRLEHQPRASIGGAQADCQPQVPPAAVETPAHAEGAAAAVQGGPADGTLESAAVEPVSPLDRAQPVAAAVASDAADAGAMADASEVCDRQRSHAPLLGFTPTDAADAGACTVSSADVAAGEGRSPPPRSAEASPPAPPAESSVRAADAPHVGPPTVLQGGGGRNGFPDIAAQPALPEQQHQPSGRSAAGSRRPVGASARSGKGKADLKRKPLGGAKMKTPGGPGITAFFKPKG